MTLTEKNPRQLLQHWRDLWFGDSKRNGYVRVTDLDQYHQSYGAKDINALERNTRGVEKRFISLNAFTFGSRKTANLRQIRNVAVDLDQYKLNMTIEEGIDALHCLILEDIIPEPNLVLTSRGIQIFYTIENGASPEVSWLVEYITVQFIAKLKHVGADSKAKDLARVMRVPGSVNERNGEEVKWEIWNKYPYSLHELQQFCKPLDAFNSRQRYSPKSKVSRLLPKVHDDLSLFYRTNHVRLQDLEKLVELRQGNFTNLRNIFIYVYTFHQALLCGTLEFTELLLMDVYDQIHSLVDRPMTQTELKTTIKSAYTDSKRFFEQFKENGYKVIYKPNDGVIKPYSNENLIQLLDITEEEQRFMKRLHTGKIKKEKENERRRRERREVGMKSMKEYNEVRQVQKKDKLRQLQKVMEDHPGVTNKELARLLEVSDRYVRKLKVELNEIRGGGTHVSL